VGSRNRTQTRRTIDSPGLTHQTITTGTLRTAKVFQRTSRTGDYSTIKKPIHSILLFHQKEGWKVTISARLSTSQSMDHQKSIPTTTYTAISRLSNRMHFVHQIRHTMGLQQHPHQRRGRMESRVLNKRRTIQTNCHVFWAYELTRNLPNYDEHDICGQSSGRMAYNLYG
jgi:hypothetical protein